ncbi:unnamed protein product [Caenorhabditis nigoni]
MSSKLDSASSSHAPTAKNRNSYSTESDPLNKKSEHPVKYPSPWAFLESESSGSGQELKEHENDSVDL